MALSRHDEAQALAALADVPTHVLVGERDRLTPVSHSRRLAELVPHAELDVLPDVGTCWGSRLVADVGRAPPGPASSEEVP